MMDFESFEEDYPEIKECECCGAKSVVENNEIDVVNSLMDSDGASFNVCVVCGDSFIKQEMDSSHKKLIKVIYQPSSPDKLVKYTKTELSDFYTAEEENTHDWIYLYNEERISKSRWEAILEKRRKVLKSIAVN